MAIDTVKMRRGGVYEGDQRAKLPVYASGSEVGNKVWAMDHPMRELFITNDSLDNNDLTLQVTGDADLDLTFAIKMGETINERFPEFTVLTVTATDGWRWYVRSGRVT